LPDRKGLPPGHAAVSRELVVPVYRGERVVAILGVGNKPTDYTEKDAEAVAYLADIVWEITRRKQAEDKIKTLLQEKELLLREVHHRIKNNMSTIASLLELQAEIQNDLPAQKALQDGSTRVHSMMVLYDQLYRSESFRTVSIYEYFPPLLDKVKSIFPHRDEVHIQTQLEDIVLDHRYLFPLGIILNELTTNAMKYAFPGYAFPKQGSLGVDEPSGQQRLILVTATREASDVCILFEDNGVGMPATFALETPSGFGMQLVGMLVQQIDGSIAIERNQGTRFKIRFTPRID
jgi:two-component sensor histidine kinase